MGCCSYLFILFSIALNGALLGLIVRTFIWNMKKAFAILGIFVLITLGLLQNNQKNKRAKEQENTFFKSERERNWMSTIMDKEQQQIFIDIQEKIQKNFDAQKS